MRSVLHNVKINISRRPKTARKGTALKHDYSVESILTLKILISKININIQKKILNRGWISRQTCFSEKLFFLKFSIIMKIMKSEQIYSTVQKF